jgi:hypothetical protein
MKSSKASNFYHIIGLLFLLLSGIVCTIKQDLNILFLGFFALCVFWILGIEVDLYRNSSKKDCQK